MDFVIESLYYKELYVLGSYYIPKGCPKMDQNECQKLCDKLCASKVKNPKGYCGNVMRNVDADSCYCT